MFVSVCVCSTLAVSVTIKYPRANKLSCSDSIIIIIIICDTKLKSSQLSRTKSAPARGSPILSSSCSFRKENVFKSFTRLLHWLGEEMSGSFETSVCECSEHTGVVGGMLAGVRSVLPQINNCNHVGNENAGRKIIAHVCECVCVIKDKPK